MEFRLNSKSESCLRTACDTRKAITSRHRSRHSWLGHGSLKANAGAHEGTRPASAVLEGNALSERLSMARLFGHFNKCRGGRREFVEPPGRDTDSPLESWD